MTDTMDKAVRAAAVKLYGKDPMRHDVLEAALQAALGVLLPEACEQGPQEGTFMGEPVIFPNYPGSQQYNACLSEIRKRAGME